MSVHYNAFISYRHSKEDMNAAALVQRSLERFRIPAKIREKTGIKKIDRIFRDKEELPITSSLNDNISEALDHSDFLIVICSVSTKESYWVRREIQYFLKSHSKNKVLTVLVNGEPQDVIPEILRVDREMRIKPDGTEYVEEINRDPLSCDLRSGNRRSKRYEIMRLAAALLGCGYDELVMREKQYNRRRLSAVIGSVFISMLCALIYLKWSRDQIKENYQRSLENQSMYLSTEAENLLEEGARITAIQLAAAALPHNGERPLVPEAERALAEGLHVYVAPNSGVIDTVYQLKTDGFLEDFDISPDERHICVLDSYSRVYIWDALTGEEILRINNERDMDTEGKGIIGDGRKVLFGADDNIFVLTETHVQSYNISDGSLQWVYDLGKETNNDCMMELDSSMQHLYLGYRKKSSKYGAMFGAELICVCLDTVSGTETSILVAEDITEDQDIDCQAGALSKDGQYFALGFKNCSTDDNTVAVYVFDMVNSTISKMDLPVTNGDINSLLFIGTTDDLAVMTCPYDDIFFGRTLRWTKEEIFIGENRIHVSLFDVRSGSCIWSNEFTSDRSTQVPKGEGLAAVDYAHSAAADGELSHYVMCSYANQAVLFKKEDGKVYDSIEFEGLILNAFTDGSRAIRFLLNNGNIGRYLFDEQWKGTEYSVFHNELYFYGYIYRNANTGSFCYFLKNSENSMRVFGNVCDEDITRFEAAPLPSEFETQFSMFVGDYFVLSGKDGSIYSYDLSGHNNVVAGNLEYLDPDSLRNATADYENKTVWICESGESNQLIRFSVTDGNIIHYELNDEYIQENKFWLLRDGKICYILPFDYDLIVCEETDGTIVSMRYASVGNDMYIEGVEASPDGRHILISGKDHDKHNKMVRFFELEDGIQMEPEQPGNGSQPKTDQEWFVSEMSIGDYVRAAAWDEQEKYCAFTDSQTVYVTDTKGNLLFKTGKARLTPRSLCIHDNVLFVLYSEGRLARYDLYSGEELGVTQIAYLSTAGSGELPLRTPLNNSEWIFRNDVLIIARGDFFHIIETQSWKEIARSESIFGYDSQKDRLISYDTDAVSGEVYIGWYPRYTVEDLLWKADKTVEKMRMSEEERVMYGLE